MVTDAQTRRCSWLRILLRAGGLFILGGLTVFVVVSISIGRGVRSISEAARQRYGGDSVEALILRLEDSSGSLRERNRAVWALGQLGDRRALPTLRKYYTGLSCDHNHALCQHELDKAIRLLDGGVNLKRPSSLLARLYAGPRVARAERTWNTKSQK